MDARNLINRRRLLEIAALAGARLTVGCAPDQDHLAGPSGSTTGQAGSGSGAGQGSGGGGGEGGAGGAGPGPVKPFNAGISSFTDPSRRAQAIEKAIDLIGGMSFVKPGDKVLIKVAHNSPNPYPATASPESAGEIARLCLEAGASKVYVADLMGIENTLVPGGWAMEDMFVASNFHADSDATLRAFHASGLYAGVEAAVGSSNIGPDQKVHITSFREHGYHRWESASATPGGAANARLVSSFIRTQLENGVNQHQNHEPRIYTPRVFDLGHDEVPGIYQPNLFDEVDHIVNVHRVATHVMSHFSTALKNWIGTMRPDDRIWMHQLSYLLNQRGQGSDPIRTEPPYHEILGELHLGTFEREKLIFADASQVIVSGGPDTSPNPFFPAQLMMASTDLVTADVVNLAVLRMGVLAALIDGGLGGSCEPQPETTVESAFDYLVWRLSIDENGLMRGTDSKLCDPSFSNWDWVALQRARELGLGASLPADVGLHFSSEDGFAVNDATRAWIQEDALRSPQHPI